MGNVELEEQVVGIGCLENCVDGLGRLADRVHVIVEAKLDAVVGDALANLSEEFALQLVVGGCEGLRGLGA